MDKVSTLERVFSYKAKANSEMLAAMRQFDDASPAREIAIRVLSHTYAVDRIFAANLTGTEHGYTSPNPSLAPSLEDIPLTRSAKLLPGSLDSVSMSRSKPNTCGRFLN